MHSSMGSHTSFFPKELKCTHGPFRLDFIKEKAIWPHLSGGVFAGEEGCCWLWTATSQWSCAEVAGCLRRAQVLPAMIVSVEDARC